jgi:hypothetical protein
MIYETDFLADNVIVIKSKILGCTFKYKMQSEIELLLAAETFAAFFENYFSTSFKELLPHSEEILIRLIKNEKVRLFDFSENDSGSEYTVDINKFSFPKESFPQLWEKMVNFTVHIISNNFFSKDILGHLDNLFKYEELHERLAFVYEYRNFIISVLGDNPKLFWRDWSRDKKEYCLRGNELINFKIVESKETNSKINDNSFTESRHDENKVISIIQDKLWNQAIWKGFGPFYANFGFGIFLAFENGNAGKAIFDDWISRFGKEDKDEIIKITIIKGVNKNNPYWYKVHISANYQSKLFNSKERYFSVTARFHQMTPDNPENLYRIEKIIGNKKPFLFFPAMITKDGKDLVPFIDKAIVKNNIDIKNAWELSINDPDSVVILNDDDPIIPIEIKNAPVLEILQNRK